MGPSLSISVNHLRRALQAVLPGSGATSRRAPTVLVVDDEPLIVQGLAAILNGEGFTVLTAFDAQSALKLVQKTSPDLLISDVNMPGMDGIELAMRLVTALPSMKVLLFSADFDKLKLSFKHQEESHFSLLAKPIHPQHMLEQVRATLEGATAAGASALHNTVTEGDGVVVGSRPRTNRRTSLPMSLEESPKAEVQNPNLERQPVDVRLSARRYFLKTADARMPLALPRPHRPSFSERHASPRMSRGIQGTKPSLSAPPASQ